MYFFSLKKQPLTKKIQLKDQESKNEFKTEKAMYHANQISEHSKIEETVKDDFHDPNNNRHQDGEVNYTEFLAATLSSMV